MSDIETALTADEQAYFSSGGNVAEKEPETEVVEVVELDDIETEIDDTEAPVDVDEPAKPQKTVPLKALHESRERLRAEQTKARETELQLARVTERFNLMFEQQKQVAQEEQLLPPPPPPEFDQDPVAAFEYESKQRVALQQQLQAMLQHQQEQLQVQQLVAFVKPHVDAFAQTTPDYYDAVNHLKAVRETELAALGYDPATINQIVQGDERDIVMSAAQRGLNPAEIAYNIAKGRGFAPKADAPKLDAQPKPSTKSLSQAGGSAAGAEMTAADLIAMSQEDFASFMTKNPVKTRKIMGG